MVAPVSIMSSAVGGVAPRNVLDLIDFAMIHNCLLSVSTNSILVYTDGSLAGLGTVGMWAGAAVFFDSVDLGLGVEVFGLVFFTMAKLQAIALALECVSPSSSVHLFSDSQVALDACKSELGLVVPDFQNRCWLERCYIYDLIHNKNLNICWFKVKRHSGVLDNEHADTLAMTAAMSEHFLPLHVNMCYILAGGVTVSENFRYFVYDIFYCIYCAQWEIGSSSRILVTSLHGDVNWHKSSFVWYSDMYMATSSTGKCSADARTYFMKALYHCLSVAVCKCLYNRSYSSVLCLYYGKVEVFNHVFFCGSDTAICAQLLNIYVAIWEALSGLPWSSSQLMQLILSCVSDTLLCLAFCKSFMFKLCFQEVVSVFRDSKIACQKVIEFVQNFCFAFRDEIWLVCVSHRALIEKCSLIPRDSSVSGLVCGLSLLFSAGVIKMLGIAKAFGISSGFHASCLFFAGIRDSVLVIINA
ncbi:hypothetical protein G9A89_006225 [Geosiphon pyriformis]|nr:hypothetical protein G9A89_006225 [Geosiphon pyriformis]